jgi:hypothetical protein
LYVICYHVLSYTCIHIHVCLYHAWPSSVMHQPPSYLLTSGVARATSCWFLSHCMCAYVHVCVHAGARECIWLYKLALAYTHLQPCRYGNASVRRLRVSTRCPDKVSVIYMQLYAYASLQMQVSAGMYSFVNTHIHNTCLQTYTAVEYAFEPFESFYDILEEARGKGGSTTEAVSTTSHAYRHRPCMAHVCAWLCVCMWPFWDKIVWVCVSYKYYMCASRLNVSMRMQL